VRRCKLRVRRKLVERIYPSVSNSDTSKVDPRVFFQLQFARNVWYVVTGVALTSDIDFTTFEFRVLDHKVVQEVVKVFRDRIFGPAQRLKRVVKGKACAKRLIHIHDVGLVRPRPLIVFECKRLFNMVGLELVVLWSVFGVESEHGGASWTALEPDDKGISFWVSS